MNIKFKKCKYYINENFSNGASGLVRNAISEESKSTKYEWVFLNSSMCNLKTMKIQNFI